MIKLEPATQSLFVCITLLHATAIQIAEGIDIKIQLKETNVVMKRLTYCYLFDFNLRQQAQTASLDSIFPSTKIGDWLSFAQRRGIQF